MMITTPQSKIQKLQKSLILRFIQKHSGEYSIHALVKEPHGARVGGAGTSYIS